MIDLDFESEINKKYFLNLRGEAMTSYTKEEIKELTDVISFAGLDNLRDIIHQNAVNKGFWENPMSIKQAWLLIDTEIGESYEAYRCNRILASNNKGIMAWHFVSEKFISESYDTKGKNRVFEERVKDTFEDEIADVVIRILDFCGYYKDYIGSIDEYVRAVLKYDDDEQLDYLNRIGIDAYHAEYNEFEENLVDDIWQLKHSILSIGSYEFIEDWTVGDSWVSPIGFLIDVLIFAYQYDIDIHSHVLAKHLYNTTREYKHGKSF